MRKKTMQYIFIIFILGTIINGCGKKSEKVEKSENGITIGCDIGCSPLVNDLIKDFNLDLLHHLHHHF